MPIRSPATQPHRQQPHCQQPGRQRAGFTLVEMLIVIAIIAVLAGLLLPTIGMAQRKGYETKSRSIMSQVEAGISQFYSQNQYYPADDRAVLPAVTDKDNPAELQSEHFALLYVLTEELASVMPDEFDLQNSPNVKRDGGNYIIVDAWDMPLYYRPFTTYPLADNSTATIAIDRDPAPRSESYHLWSTGSDMLNNWGEKATDDIVNWR